MTPNNPEAVEVIQAEMRPDDLVWIWSDEHDAYWRPEGAGYTRRAGAAGVFTYREAKSLTSHCGPEKRIEIEPVPRLQHSSEPSGEEVERVARIIDPSSWTVMDSYLEQTKRKYRGQNVGWPADQFQPKESMEKARQILAALSTPSTEPSRPGGDEVDLSGVDRENAAWDWLDATFANVERGDDPVDRAYSADEMVDAFHAGFEYRPSTDQPEGGE